jgi:EmrB/QacA subfamily drug resistance transporter
LNYLILFCNDDRRCVLTMAAVPRAETGPAEAPDPRRWKALALLCTAFFMVILDSAIVVVALPSIDQELAFSAGSLQWVLSAYLLSFGGLLLLGGRAADLLGRRRLFIAGTGLFGLASLACGLAASETALIGARVVQGVGAAIMTPTALSILATTFTEGAERNKALGVWAMIGGAGATSAWLIGGPITDGLGWEWIFFINIPVALGVVALSPVLLRESRDREQARRFDVAGAATITAALVALVYAVVEAPEAGWADGQTLGLLALSVALIGLFAVIESRSVAPLAPLRVFRSRSLVGGNLTLLVLGMLAFGMPFTLTQYAQQVLDYSPIEFGLGSAIMPVMSAIGSASGQAIATRRGVSSIVVVSMVLTGAGCLLLTQVSVGGTYLGDIFVGLLVFGPGLGAGYVAGSIASLGGVPESEAGLASGLNNSSFQIGGAIGVAILSSVAISQADGADPLVALTNGFQSAFATAIIFAGIGLLVAILLLRQPRRAAPAPAPAPEPAVAPAE